MAGLWGLWEPEEAVGRWWHRWASTAGSYSHHPEAAVWLRDLSPRLGVFFRALGGCSALRLAASDVDRSGHRLRLRQRLGLGEQECWETARVDGEALLLPPCLDYFPQQVRNEQLYFWLTAFLAHGVSPGPCPVDPLQADVLRLRAIDRTVQCVLRRWPGLAERYKDLCAALCGLRPRRRLPPTEAAVEEVVLRLLDAVPATSRYAAALDAAVRDPFADISGLRAPPGYRTYLPVPLWGVVERATATGNAPGAPEEPRTTASVDVDERRRRARRREAEQTEREDALILNRFETLQALAEMINLNRKVEDDDPQGARQAAEDMAEISLVQHSKHAGSRLKLDLELAPAEAATTMLQGEHTFPEWDFRRRRYHPEHCRVLTAPADEHGEDWQPDAEARRRIRAVRRQFEALRPRRRILRGEADGDELDLSALVRSMADRRAGGPGSERVYAQARSADRDLAVAILVDVSLSTDSWVDNRRVLDVEKESVLALCCGLAACGDEHAVFAFSSHKRQRVSVTTVKSFEEPLSGAPIRRLHALRPGYYTRMGAALRFVSARLAERPNRHRLLLLLSDGKPNDFDHYEGRYGVEDTRRSIREARRLGLSVFGITVDRKARDYFPFLFGRGAYAIVNRIGRLPCALPAIYRQLTG